MDAAAVSILILAALLLLVLSKTVRIV
ncbi:MAG: hypothetical protein QOD10_5307, partial [Mycobacterium sp.]|nr:hypothetical protein [Mycobacterium sp.]